MIYRTQIRNNFKRDANNNPISAVTINPPFERLITTYANRQPLDYDVERIKRTANPENPNSPDIRAIYSSQIIDDVILTSGTSVSSTNYKHLTLPLFMNFEPMDNSDLIDDWVSFETNKVINEINNGETVKYTNYPGVDISFRFYDKGTDTFDDTMVINGYGYAGFLPEEINKKNNFKRSYFRLYFFDSNDGNTRNLLFTEDIDVFGSIKPSFNLNRLYWLRDDQYYLSTNSDRTFYMEARFFNAKTGRVHKFINPPTTLTSPMGVTTYANPANKEWRTSPIKFKNPFTNSGRYEFEPIIGVGGNQTLSIIMTEYILS